MSKILQPHLKVRKLNKYVLMPGDPFRIDLIKKFLDRPKEIMYNRELEFA